MSLISAIFGTRKEPFDFSGFTDWHSHILPGVDDGVATMEESLEILNAYEKAGIKEVWLTPHIMEDVPNTTSMLRSRFEILQDAWHGNVTLHLASENMLDNLFLTKLEAGDLLPIGSERKHLLVETSYFNAPLGFHNILESIKTAGYFPLLAHPERYNYISTMDEYRKLKEMGVLFQLNLMSLGGHYGPGVREKSLRLLSEGMYDRVGSDIHRKEHTDIMSALRLSHDTVDAVSHIVINS